MKGFFAILIFLTGTVLALSYPHHSADSTRRLLNDAMEVSSSVIKPPKAMKVKHEMKMFGDVRNDSYYWIRGDPHSNPKVLAYLQEENKYTDFIMSGTKEVEDRIYSDIIRRIRDKEISTPRRRGPYYFYERTLPGKDYRQYCRRRVLNNGDKPSIHDVMPTGPYSPPEHVILDVNVRAQGKANYISGDFQVSPNHKLVAYTEDTRGDQNCTAHIIDAESTQPVEMALIGLGYIVVWAGNKALLYTTTDKSHRPEKVWLHKLGEKQSNDLCLYHEKDKTFFLSLQASASQEFVFIQSESVNTSYVFYFDIAHPQYGFRPLTPRIDGIQTLAAHQGDYFFIKRTSDELYNSELIACPVNNVSAIITILPHRESVTISDLQLFSNHLVVFERENSLPKVVVFNLPSNGERIEILQIAQAIDFMEPAYALFKSDSDFNSNILRFTYSTLKTPDTVFDYDLNTGISVRKSTETVLGGFNSSNYHTDRIWATSPDGIQVPMSIVYRKDLVKLDGLNPLLLYGYGANGLSFDPIFKSYILPLLDRGFIYVIAHVRGGGEMGSQWYKNGILLNKKNTFTDFIACAEYLIERKYTTNRKLVIHSWGSGGMIIGAVINSRPDLFKVAIAESTFLDVLTTLLDPTLSDKEEEIEQWGDPNKQEFYNYIKTYSPLDNVRAQRYPSILVTTGDLNYYRPYSDSAKFVAKLRDVKIGESLLLLKSNLSVSPSANPGRFAFYKKQAFVFTFILKAMNMVF